MKWELNQQVWSSTKVGNLCCAQIHTWCIECVHIAISLERWKNKYEVHFSLAWSIRKLRRRRRVHDFFHCRCRCCFCFLFRFSPFFTCNFPSKLNTLIPGIRAFLISDGGRRHEKVRMKWCTIQIWSLMWQQRGSKWCCDRSESSF